MIYMSRWSINLQGLIMALGSKHNQRSVLGFIVLFLEAKQWSCRKKFNNLIFFLAYWVRFCAIMWPVNKNRPWNCRRNVLIISATCMLTCQRRLLTKKEPVNVSHFAPSTPDPFIMAQPKFRCKIWILKINWC